MQCHAKVANLIANLNVNFVKRVNKFQKVEKPKILSKTLTFEAFKVSVIVGTSPFQTEMGWLA